ncbi:restriction endonuclease subunit S [Lactobacillus kullabergensis]|uniref:Type I restriction modification DNA specificity domain-containing protein n=1 Tax=Lactobacillus kullabergensis TaxID=1218493 RepID=A0ABM6VZI9_9LACO|nr:restriction endonuclease subunit S [Lactobacillus kullabergensis]AWM74969.1 hypothetical protein DKL58_02855 [Lactobacillus kullabergensis]
MNKHNSVPSIRFNGFKDEWKLSKLGNDLISIHTGTNLLGSETPGGIPLIKMGNLKNGFFDFSKLDYLPICENVKNEDKVRFGDFLFNTRNTLDLVGKGATWMYESTKFAYNNNIAKFNFQNSINTVFFNYLYNTYNVMNQVHARATGTTSVAAIYPKSLDSIIYNLPSKQEQQKIGNFFAKLDKLLDLQQQKIEKLELLKKALLQKLFPKHDAKIPELRFKGFEDEWEPKYLGKLGFFESGNGFPKNEQGKKIGIPFFKVSDLGSSFKLTKAKNYVAPEQIKSNKWKVIDPTKNGAIVFAKIGAAIFLNRKRLVMKPFLIDNNLMAYVISENVNRNFVMANIQMINFSKFVQVGAIPSINSGDLKKIKISQPINLSEQQKIGNLLSKVDQLIELENKKLQDFQQVKKCLLQNMFVE